MLSKISTVPRRKLLLPLVALSLVASAAVAQQKADDRGVPDVQRLRAAINYLASDKLEGRRTGTPGAKEAAQYVAEEFNRYGLRQLAKLWATPSRPPSSVVRVMINPCTSKPARSSRTPWLR